MLLILGLFIPAVACASGMHSVHVQSPATGIPDLAVETDFSGYHSVRPDLIEQFIYGKEGRTQGAKASKLPAALVTLFLGPFGAHRVYLGTEAKVPVIYTLTLGGGFGVLPLIDLITIALTKDLQKYIDNKSVIMWMNADH